MDNFKDELLKHKRRVLSRKDSIQSEEGAKTAFINPFLRLLGYDTTEPLEVVPEYDAYYGKQKGPKVDYAIFLNGKLEILIEAKSVNENLSKYGGQLEKYFNAVDVPLGILTNGVEYRFFTDIDRVNAMDKEPFFTFSFEDFKNTDTDVIAIFCKSVFDKQLQRQKAEELLATIRIQRTLNTLLTNPSDEFIRLLYKEYINKGKFVDSVYNKLRPIVKDAIDSILPAVHSKEMQAYDIVKEILEKAKRDTADLMYKETAGYFRLHKGKKSTNFIRFAFRKSFLLVFINLPYETVQSSLQKEGYEIKKKKAYLTENETSIKVSKIDDIYSLSKLIAMAYDSITTPVPPNNHAIKGTKL